MATDNLPRYARPMNRERPATFEEVVEKYGDFVYNVALRMTSDPVEAEDVTQEAFMDAFRAWDRFRGDAQVSTWLYRITVNRSLMRGRKERRERQYVQGSVEDREIVDWTQGPEQAAIGAELRSKLEEAMALLPEELRAAVVLRDVQGLSNEEAAEALEITVPALKARLHRGRVLLRKLLQDYTQASFRQAE
ncbi:MAG: sigma-70 family RNA polymerase sigma factor [Chloroflexi bacterium]|nr:sigma-70 family RNA polymerase sigma factor [Chloroflexota bacterium]